MPDSRRILLIGDHPIMDRLRQRPYLQGHEFEACDGGIQALHRVRARDISVVVTDPAQSLAEDFALSTELRAARPGIKIIVLAPASSPEDVIEALRAHVFAYYTPPFDASEIAEMAARGLDLPDWRDGIEVVSGTPQWLSLRVSCRLVTAERLVRFLAEYQTELPTPEREALIAAFREMLLNAMEHGAGFDPEQVVEVTAARTERAIVYHLKDPGPGFDRTDLPHAAVSNPPGDPAGHLQHRLDRGMRPGGFGILITKQVVDELVYNERGNQVMLIKHLK
jgi:anti-sigma regulatory factor (Ser/Thr protein kinase)/ActR/RegA family two-component response regulator